MRLIIMQWYMARPKVQKKKANYLSFVLDKCGSVASDAEKLAKPITCTTCACICMCACECVCARKCVHMCVRVCAGTPVCVSCCPKDAAVVCMALCWSSLC